MAVRMSMGGRMWSGFCAFRRQGKGRFADGYFVDVRPCVVPSVIHGNVSHTGGINAMNKKGAELYTPKEARDTTETNKIWKIKFWDQ